MSYDLPPPRDWQVFEDLCRDLWVKLWRDPHAQKHGRTGQKQRGVDVFGQPAGGSAWEGVQCKRYERQLTREEIEHEVDEARTFRPGLRRLIVATTTKRDVGTQEIVREISDAEEAKGSFPVKMWSWDDITETLAKHHDLLRHYYPAYAGKGAAYNLPYPSLGDLFKGRDAVLAALDDDPGQATAIVQPGVIHGLGGIGKTRLAVEYAWRTLERFSGGVFFVAAETPEILRTSLAGLASSDLLALPEHRTAGEDEAVAAVLRHLRDRSDWLMILDNADTAEAAEAVEELLPRLDQGRVLVTSRWTSWKPGIHEQPLNVLGPEDARRFLLDSASRRQQSENDEEDAERLAELLGYLPLALEQAAAYIDRYRLSFATYVEEWQAERKKVLKWFDERRTHYPAPVAVTWQRTFDRLSSGAQTVLRLASQLAPEPIPEGIFETGTEHVAAARAAACEELGRKDDEIELRDVLAELADVSLVGRDGGQLTVHRVVQEVVRSRVPEERRRDWVVWALEVVNAAAVGDPLDVRDWGVWDPLRPHVERIVRAADAEGIVEPTSRLMSQLDCLLDTKGLKYEAERWSRRALTIDEEAYGPEHPIVAVRLNNLAQLLQHTNRLNEAEPLMRRALDIDENAFGPQHPDVARDLNNLAQLLKETNRLKEAEPLMRRALDIDENAFGPQHPDVARDLNNLAQLLKETNRLKEAEPLMRRALDIDENAFGPQHPDVARDLNNLAQLLQHTNRLKEAEPLMRRALDIDENAFGPQHPDVAIDLNNLALLLKATNRLKEAEPLMRRALDIDEKAFGPQHPNVARDLNNLALLLQETNRLKEAEPLMRRALDILEASLGDDHPWTVGARNNLAAMSP